MADFKTDQAIDIMRNSTTNPPDNVKKFSYKAGGGKIVTLFDGAEKVVSWNVFPWYLRTVSTPQFPATTLAFKQLAVVLAEVGAHASSQMAMCYGSPPSRRTTPLVRDVRHTGSAGSVACFGGSSS